MAEEQKMQEAVGHKLCANNCGFFGSPTTLNLCSKCYKDHCLKEQQMSMAKEAVEKTFASGSTSEVSVSISLPARPEPVVSEAVAVPAVDTAAKPNRCGTCKKRVGLTGFTCRCGITFCGTHRYAEQHGCTFDFKSMGKEAIAKANPVVKAEKLDKI